MHNEYIVWCQMHNIILFVHEQKGTYWHEEKMQRKGNFTSNSKFKKNYNKKFIFQLINLQLGIIEIDEIQGCFYILVKRNIPS